MVEDTRLTALRLRSVLQPGCRNEVSEANVRLRRESDDRNSSSGSGVVAITSEAYVQLWAPLKGRSGNCPSEGVSPVVGAAEGGGVHSDGGRSGAASPHHKVRAGASSGPHAHSVHPPHLQSKYVLPANFSSWTLHLAEKYIWITYMLHTR